MTKALVNKKIIFSLWWKIFLEIVLLIVLFFIIDILSWWTMSYLSELFWGCELYGRGFLKAPGVSCDHNIFWGKSVETLMSTYSTWSWLIFFLLMWFFIGGFKLSLPLIIIISLILAILIRGFLKEISSKSKQLMKFPILTRIVIKNLARLSMIGFSYCKTFLFRQAIQKKPK
ncbi:MAG: hypothetical protein GF390_01480 [Candidatus Pacebacteria bacterium]|nr:hypothetical protein [Candidatus Paceibacterota bacterium]